MLSELKIPTTPERGKAQDHAHLYSTALAHIRDLSHRIWTDYNTHDPGITVLEILSYAITDLGYRSGMPVEDLLASPEDNAANMRAQFHTARQILPGRALTQLDYRKLLIDLPGVKNAWLAPAPLTCYADKLNARLMATDNGQPGVEPIQVRGLYQVLIDFVGDLRNSDKPGILANARAVLNANRNLCEDFVSFSEIETQPFLLCGEFELRPEADTRATHARILLEVQNYLAPDVRNYTLAQMLERRDSEGNPVSVDEIFRGPLLKCGFIPDQELAQAELRSEIRLSDLINLIMDIPGVQAVRELLINPTGMALPPETRWLIAVAPGKKARLDGAASRLVFQKRGMPIGAAKAEALAQFAALQAQQTRKLELETTEDLPVPLGRYRDPANYLSLQNHFPAIYGLSENGPPPGADARREAQALQFSAYLLFFDQLLANYLAQLARLRELFTTDPALKRSYFYQVVDSFKHWGKVYAPADPVAAMEAEVEPREVHMARRNRFLDHLIARFAESFTEFAEVMHGAFGSSETILAGYKCAFLNDYPRVSADRGLAYNHTLANPAELWNSANISGLEQRLCKLLGIANCERRNLSEVSYDIYDEIDSTPGDEFRFRVRHKVTGAILLSSSTNYVTPEAAKAEMRRAILFGKLRMYYQVRTARNGQLYCNIVDDTGEVIARRIQFFSSMEALDAAIDEVITYLNTTYCDEGMYVIENLLLRPEQPSDPFLPICVDPNCTDCADSDPYSYRIHIILPAYGPRFADMDFRRYAETLIRSEVPAHILPKICWIDRHQMAQLEGPYQEWLKLKSGRVSARRLKRLTDFITRLYAAKNVYPPERLRNCDSEEGLNRFVLNRTALGSFLDEDGG